MRRAWISSSALVSSESRKMANPEELQEKLVSVNRVSKVVKGGRQFGFTALTKIGEQYGTQRFAPYPGTICHAYHESTSLFSLLESLIVLPSGVAKSCSGESLPHSQRRNHSFFPSLASRLTSVVVAWLLPACSWRSVIHTVTTPQSSRNRLLRSEIRPSVTRHRASSAYP